MSQPDCTNLDSQISYKIRPLQDESESEYDEAQFCYVDEEIINVKSHTGRSDRSEHKTEALFTFQPSTSDHKSKVVTSYSAFSSNLSMKRNKNLKTQRNMTMVSVNSPYLIIFRIFTRNYLRLTMKTE